MTSESLLVLISMRSWFGGGVESGSGDGVWIDPKLSSGQV